MPDTRNYYCICEDNCKFPTMTYEQILEAIAEATGNVPTHVEDAFITLVKESNANTTLSFWKGTQAEFNALGVTAPVYKVGIGSNGKLYFTPLADTDVQAHASRHASGGEDEIDPADIGALPDSGGTMGGNIDMDSHKITNLATPTANADAATKQYVDNGDIGIWHTATLVTPNFDTSAVQSFSTQGIVATVDLDPVIDFSKYYYEMEIVFHGAKLKNGGSPNSTSFEVVFSHDNTTLFDRGIGTTCRKYTANEISPAMDIDLDWPYWHKIFINTIGKIGDAMCMYTKGYYDSTYHDGIIDEISTYTPSDTFEGTLNKIKLRKVNQVSGPSQTFGIVVNYRICGVKAV